MQQRIAAWPAVLGPGALAGFAGAVLIDLYLLATLVAATHVATVASFFAFVASGLVGRAAYADPDAVYLGVAIHLAVGVAWGIGYASVATRTPQVRDRPLLSGTVFGLLVMIAMQLVEVAANIYVLPDSARFANGIVAHCAFFGIPVAYVVKNRLRA